MKITLMNASMRAENSASKLLTDQLIALVKDDEYGVLPVNPDMNESFAVAAVNASDAVVLVSPIYLSGLPSSALAMMDIIEAKVKKKGLKVGAVLQCGFYETENTRIAMELIKNWCSQNGYQFTGGIGIGGGPALKPDRKISKRLQNALAALLQGLHEGKGESVYFSVPSSRWLYNHACRRYWRRQIRQNGLHVNDLSLKPKGPSEKFSKES